MKLNPFKLEVYLAKREFLAPYLLCCSDAESIAMKELLAMADESDQRLWGALRLSYTEAPGHPILRDVIASELYTALKTENILVTVGAEEGIFCGLSHLCKPNDHVIVLTPCYQSLRDVPISNGCQVTEVVLKEKTQWRINLDDIKNAIRPHTKCIIINFPNNPTGQIITDEETHELINICRRIDAWLFSDEAYRLLGNPSQGWPPPIADLYEKGVSVGVMSKAFGMPGLRIGWLACQDIHVLKKMEEIKHYTSICCSGPSEILSIIALRNKNRILDRNNAIVSSNLKLLQDFMIRYDDTFEWVEPQGGCVGFVKYKKDENINVFCDNLLKSKGVLLMPADIYDYPGNYFRIGFGRSNMPESLENLEEFLKCQ